MTWAIFSDSHLRAIAEIIESGSDRVAAIVGGALLDDTLHRTLAERLRNDKDISRKLLKVNGPLGNAVPKIDFLYMLCAFDKPVRNALYGLANVRNFYAHNLDASLDSQEKEMTDALKLLTLHKGRAMYPHHIYDGDTNVAIEPIRTNRDKFLINLRLCLIALMRDRVSHKTWSNKNLTKKALHEQKQEWKQQEAKKSSTNSIVTSSVTNRPATNSS